MAPLVAVRLAGPQQASEVPENKGWTVKSLETPEVSYNDLFGKDLDIILSTIDKVLSAGHSGIIKMVDPPAPNIEDEVLKRLFGSVFVYPIRGSDQTFNVSSHNHVATRKVGLPNYDTSQVLLPHTDHAFYDNPIQVQGFYNLEGTSTNTWTSPLAALGDAQIRSPELLPCPVPSAHGCRSRLPPLR